MKYLTLVNSDDGFIIQEVDGKKSTFCNTAFIYKDGSIYHLVDINTGLSIVKSIRQKYLSELFEKKKKQYEEYCKSDAYKIKVERFERIKLVSNYGKDHK